MTTFQIILLFLIPLLTVLIPIYLGQQYGLYIHKKYGEAKDAPIGSVVGATFGLLAFLLAFTFQMVDTRYSARKELLLKESCQIRTTYLRTGIIGDSLEKPCKKILKEYVDIRLEAFTQPSWVNHLIVRSQEILDELWLCAEYLNKLDRSSEAYALFTSSVNDLTDTFHERVAVTLNYRIPETILWVLSIITFFSMLLLGYQFGISGKFNFMLNLFMAITFASVMWLIMILDRPESGIARLNQQPLIDLQAEFSRKH